MLWLASSWWASSAISRQPNGSQVRHPRTPTARVFTTADTCMACHNGLTTPAGEDVSIGTTGAASMMANSSRDPYWQAAVRREMLDHPQARPRNRGRVCDVPHADGAHASARGGRREQVFAHLPVGARSRPRRSARRTTAYPARSATRSPARSWGRRESFTGGFVLDVARRRPASGRCSARSRSTRAGRASCTRRRVRADRGSHIRQSELCATCHTLYTTARGPRGSRSASSRSRCRTSSGATAPSRRAAQLPVLPHARRRRRTCRSPRCSASRAKASPVTSSAAATSSCSGC